jgi:hypothetical protein
MLSRIKAWAHQPQWTVTQTDGAISGRQILGCRHIFDSPAALKAGLAPVRCLEVVGSTPATARRKNWRSSRADRFDAVYLRAAQAYMLISMPTGTSTILGVFQVIPSSQGVLARTPRRS